MSGDTTVIAFRQPETIADPLSELAREALAALLGKDAPNLSPAVIPRLTAEWRADYDAWQKRDLSARRCVYVWADVVEFASAHAARWGSPMSSRNAAVPNAVFPWPKLNGKT